jgi:predicted acetyltransferase
MPAEIRTIEDGELGDWFAAMQRGFHSVRPAPDEAAIEALRPHFDVTRSWAAIDGDRIVGTARSMAGRLAVPGGLDLDTALLTQVMVSATHRRRGLLTAMLGADLAASRERGESLGYLVAAEYPIYGRFGYGPSSDAVDLVLDGRDVRFLDVAEVVVRPARPAEFREVAPALYERHWRDHPGFIDRWPRFWDQLSDLTRLDPSAPLRTHVLAYDRSGEVVGDLVYHVDDHWVGGRPDGTLVVSDLFGASPAVEAALWRFATEVDWVATVRAERRTVHEPLRWFLHDARALAEKGRRDLVWVRVLDVPAAFSGRGYVAAGRVVIEVVDKLGFAAGVFALDASPAGADCRLTTENPDVTLDVSDLGALYLGGTSATTLAGVSRIDEHRAGSVATLDAVLRSPKPPWCSTMF